MRLYICGCIGADPENYRRNFHDAHMSLIRAGYHPKSPLDNGLGADESADWLDHMKADIRMMLECDGVATIPGWKKGRGTRVEVDLARGLGLPVRSVSAWVADGDLD